MRHIPKEVQAVLAELRRNGHEAWCVGGCVRDLLLGREPDDWDVTSSALPEETMAVFGSRAIPTGLQHGTVTVKSGGWAVEVTTYRHDGSYSDHRHPDQVTFTRSLEEDLARRDFTVNAMAMDEAGDIRDPFGGREDLERKTIRCVGEPSRRFEEDALRILRGLRFASVLDFAVDTATGAAMERKAGLLREVAAERIRVELEKLLCGPGTARVLRQFPSVIGVFLPEILPMVGFAQDNPHHCHDAWEHTLHAVAAVPADPVLRMTMMLHDLGKPACFCRDERDVGHFYGHQEVSRDMAAEILSRLKYDNESRRVILLLVANHDRAFPVTDRGVRRALWEFGEQDLRRLLAVKRADNLAQAPEYRGRQAELDAAEAIMERLLREGACFSLKDLAVSGRDLMELGFSGREIGTALNILVDRVVEGVVKNDRQVLLNCAAAIRAGAAEKNKSGN